MTINTEPAPDAAVERLIEQYSEDTLKPELLLRLYCAMVRLTIDDICDSLAFREERTLQTLEALVADGLVLQTGGGRAIQYSLTLEPRTRSLITKFLCRIVGGREMHDRA